MLIRFRQRLLDWFRTADYEPGGDRFEVNAVEEASPYAPVRRPRGPRRTNALGQSQYANDAKVASIGASEGLDCNAISFKVFAAQGGIAIQVHSYDPNRDTLTVSLHVVPEDKDLAEALTHILSLESLRR
jgi:hypothetical protein